MGITLRYVLKYTYVGLEAGAPKSRDGSNGSNGATTTAQPRGAASATESDEIIARESELRVRRA